MKSPLVILVVLIVGAVVVASVTANYTRETTSAEFKYSKSAQEIDDTYYAPLLGIVEDSYYHKNAFSDTAEDAGKDPSADPDLDGLFNSLDPINPTNPTEKSQGTQYDNPDTDGDGIIDSVDSAPLDATIGQAIEILPGLGPIFAPTYRLLVNLFSKTVLNQTLGETEWKHSTQASFNDHVRFYIYASLTNENPTDDLLCTITDQLGKSLRYVPDNTGTINYYYINGTRNPLLDGWLEKGLKFAIAPSAPGHETTVIEIYFEAVVWQDPTNFLRVTLNSAKITTETQTQTDFSFVTIKSTS